MSTLMSGSAELSTWPTSRVAVIGVKPRDSYVAVTDQVIATERAFAKTMADRNQPQFSRFISAEAVFFSGENALRGKSKIVDGWLKYFKAPQAPFSWEPSKVEILESGGTFTSIWRLEAPNTWRIVFDKGNEMCNQ